MADSRKITYTIFPADPQSAKVKATLALQQGAAHLQRGELDAAQTVARKVLRTQPWNSDALQLLGIVAAREQRLADAVDYFSKALDLKADAGTLINRAAAHSLLGNHVQALADCDLAIALKPELARAYVTRGNALMGLARGQEALQSYDRAVALNAGNADAWQQRGHAQLALGEPTDALASYERALELQPGHADTHVGRGLALADLRRHAEAIASYDRALALQADHADAYANRGIALSEGGCQQEALASLDRALAIKPGHIKALANRGVCELLNGDFEHGWAHYDARWLVRAAGLAPGSKPGRTLLTPANFGTPLWDGKPTDATVLVWPEQGIGDQILFASVLPELQQRAGKVILALENRLHALFARSFPQCEIATLTAARKQGGFDVQIPFGNLGVHFRRSVDEFLQHRKAFLKADPELSASLRRQIAPKPRQRICGISWHSRLSALSDDKSMPLTALRPLFELPGLRFVDLQYGDTTAERALLKAGGGPEVVRIETRDNQRDIDGLAALIDACDVIVTVSNTTAHLAGALGKEVWIMLPHGSGRLWYWQTNRDDTLWYPRAHVVRQRQPGIWEDVVKRVAAILQTGEGMPEDPPTTKHAPPAAKAAKKKAVPEKGPATPRTTRRIRR